MVSLALREERGRRIIYARKLSKLSRRKLNLQLGITEHKLILIENGSLGVSETMLKSIAKITGQSFEWLSEGRGDVRYRKE